MLFVVDVQTGVGRNAKTGRYIVEGRSADAATKLLRDELATQEAQAVEIVSVSQTSYPWVRVGGSA